MSNLIDSLLNLSRLTRSDLKPLPVDISAMVSIISAELREREPERMVKFEIEEGVTVHGDPKLLRVMLENLIFNAWKYTSKEPVGEICFGSFSTDDEVVCYLRDNGAGFDMQYADKLFGAFQRLHREDEFEGTGIGLATVQRIVNRHGGRVWAEGEVGRGATFFFTIPPAS